MFQKVPKFSDFTILGCAEKVCWVDPLRGSRFFIFYLSHAALTPNVFSQCMLKPFGCAIASQLEHASTLTVHSAIWKNISASQQLKCYISYIFENLLNDTIGVAFLAQSIMEIPGIKEIHSYAESLIEGPRTKVV